MKHLLTILTLAILSLPTLTFAAFGDPIVPCGGSGQDPCQACHVVQLGQNLLTWFIGIMASIIVLVFAIGGLKMVMSQGNSGEVSQAKGMMTNAVIGFIILLASYLIVDTLLKGVVDGQKLGTWNKIECVAQPVYTSQDTPTPLAEGETAATTAECSDDDALIAKYKGSPIGQEDSGLQTMVSCYLANAAVAEATDSGQLYTTDRSHPRCSLTNGNAACGTCSHSANSCHYGRGSGRGAMAVDFNAKSGFTESELYSRLQRVTGCGGRLNFESNHTHISMSGC